MSHFGWAPRVAAVVAGSAFACAATRALGEAYGAGEKKPAVAAGPDANGPATFLKVAPRLVRVRFEVAKGGAIVLHDLVFPKGAVAVAGPKNAGDASIFLAFTAQARPMAIEAIELAVDDAGKIIEATSAPKLPIVDVFVKPTNAVLVLGPAKGAGHVVKVPRGDAAFALRVRTAIALEGDGSAKEVSLMARLGVRDVAAIPLERIEVVGTLGLTVRGARATLCGPSSDPTPLLVEFPGFPASPQDAGALSPSLVKRSASDDLCVDVQI